MSEVKFEAQLDFECLKDIIADIRKGAVSLDTAKKGLWVAGCALELYSPSNLPIIAESSVEADRSLMALADELEALIPAEGAVQAPVTIDPATVIMIVQLVWKLIQSLKK